MKTSTLCEKLEHLQRELTMLSGVCMDLAEGSRIGSMQNLKAFAAAIHIQGAANVVGLAIGRLK